MKRHVSWTVFVIGIVLIINLLRSIYDVVQRGHIVKDTTEQLASVRKEHAELTAEYERVNSPYFIEEQARDKLNMARPGEDVIIVPTIPAPTPTPTPEPPLANWEQWREAFRI